LIKDLIIKKKSIQKRMVEAAPATQVVEMTDDELQQYVLTQLANSEVIEDSAAIVAS